MHFLAAASVIAAALFSASASAYDFDLITGDCETGFGWTGGPMPWDKVKMFGSDGCDGCPMLTDRPDGRWTSSNPCKPCDSGQRFDYIENDDGTRTVYMEGDRDEPLGHCRISSLNWVSCSQPKFSCGGVYRHVCKMDMSCDDL